MRGLLFALIAIVFLPAAADCTAGQGLTVRQANAANRQNLRESRRDNRQAKRQSRRAARQDGRGFFFVVIRPRVRGEATTQSAPAPARPAADCPDCPTVGEAPADPST